MAHMQATMTFPKLTGYVVDKVADALLEGEFPGLVPLAVQGDGNCLFRAASLLAFGREGQHSHLRSLTVEELNGHAEFYADGFVARAESVKESGDSLSLLSLLAQTMSTAASQTFLSNLSGGCPCVILLSKAYNIKVS